MTKENLKLFFFYKMGLHVYLPLEAKLKEGKLHTFLIFTYTVQYNLQTWRSGES